MNEDIEASIQRLSQAYAEHLPVKVSEISQLWKSFKQDESPNILDSLLIKAHSLCGSSGTYGYKLVSDVSRKLEQKFYLAQKAKMSSSIVIETDDLIKDLNQLAINAPQKKLVSLANVSLLDAEKRLIYIFDDEAREKNLFEEFKQFDYTIKYFSEADEFIKLTLTEHPGLVIIDINNVENLKLEFFKELKEELIFILFMSAQDDLLNRLLTVRRGGHAFISKPFEINSLLRIVDNLFEAKKIQNEKVLIVDDSLFLADYYSMLLNQAGMLTYKVTDPKLFLSTLQEFQPDLILMDINMPFCTGTELAQIVQQQENFNGLPIIFLSSISEKSKQLEVMSYAGDEFLVKPVDPKYLIAAVRNRLLRGRMLRFRIMRDGLTNLYNHTMIHHQLERELMIAERYSQELSVVLIDLDYFKNINDTYGHQAGDKVLKDLSVFLKKHLRKSDLVGRYGGEEFLVVLPNTSAENAYRIVDNLRTLFANMAHIFNDQKMFVTLSAGISNYPEATDASSLVKLADEALYKAKETGRNKVLLADVKTR